MTQTKKQVPEKHRFAAQVNAADLQPSYNIAPGQPVAVITRQQPDRLQLLSWGLPAVIQQRPQLLINARAESLLERATYRPLLEAGKTCLILADGFYEWKQLAKNNRLPYRFLMQDADLFAIAGLYQEVIDPQTGALRQHVTLVTTTPNVLLSGIHDRMPAILPRGAEWDWLKAQGQPQHYLSLLNAYDPSLMQAYPVSKQVSNARNNYPELIQACDYADQTSQLSLF